MQDEPSAMIPNTVAPRKGVCGQEMTCHCQPISKPPFFISSSIMHSPLIGSVLVLLTKIPLVPSLGTPRRSPLTTKLGPESKNQFCYRIYEAICIVPTCSPIKAVA